MANSFFYNSDNSSISFFRKNESYTLPALATSGWGDPHMMIRAKNGAIIARWDDNASGSQDTELLYFYLKTSSHNIKIYYTNKNWYNAKIIKQVRYVYNGTENTFDLTDSSTTVTMGPVSLKLVRNQVGFNTNRRYINIVITHDEIQNVQEVGGGYFFALKCAKLNGGYINGGWGATRDGYATMASKVGITNFSRSDLVVSSGSSMMESLGISEDANGDISGDYVINLANDRTGRLVLQGIQDTFIGFNAQNNNLPLDPVALQEADMAEEDGDFDGLVNPANNTNGIIDPDGTTGAGNNDFMDEDVSDTGNYYAVPPTNTPVTPTPVTPTPVTPTPVTPTPVTPTPVTPTPVTPTPPPPTYSYMSMMDAF